MRDRIRHNTKIKTIVNNQKCRGPLDRILAFFAEFLSLCTNHYPESKNKKAGAGKDACQRMGCRSTYRIVTSRAGPVR